MLCFYSWHFLVGLTLMIDIYVLSNGQRSLVGDLFGLLSAMSYGLFTGWQIWFKSRLLFISKFLNYLDRKSYVPIYFAVNIAVLLKKFSGEEGENADVQKLFGYIGLFTLVALWWLGKCCRVARQPEGHDGVLHTVIFYVPICLGSFILLYSVL